MAPARTSRAVNDDFDVNGMCLALREFANRKDLSWDWEFSEYQKTRRSQVPDRSGLIAYSELPAAVPHPGVNPTGRKQPCIGHWKL